MVFGIGRKKTVTPALIEARSFYGSAFHFISTAEHGVEGRVAICGYDNCLPASSVREVTRELVTDSWSRQHESWHWCRGCVAVLFNLGEVELKSIALEDLVA